MISETHLSNLMPKEIVGGIAANYLFNNTTL
jgi:hypothetical protein